MKNARWREYSGGKLYGQILRTMSKDQKKVGIEALLEAGRWLCRWCSQFNAIGDSACGSCKMPRADFE